MADTHRKTILSRIDGLHPRESWGHGLLLFNEIHQQIISWQSVLSVASRGSVRQASTT